MTNEINYKDLELDKLQKLFDEEENPVELNKIMGIIAEKQIILSDDYEETNNILLEKEIYQQMSLIKLEDMESIPLEKIRKMFDKKLGKMVLDEESNEVGEKIEDEPLEINLVNNMIPKPERFGVSSGTNHNYMKTKTISSRTNSFGFKFIQTPNVREEVTLQPISQTSFILNLDGMKNREEIFECWKRGMSSVLNLNATWTTANFLNYLEHSFSGTLADWYDNLDEEAKDVLKTMESATEMFKNLCKIPEGEFIGVEANPLEKEREL